MAGNFEQPALRGHAGELIAVARARGTAGEEDAQALPRLQQVAIGVQREAGLREDVGMLGKLRQQRTHALRGIRDAQAEKIGQQPADLCPDVDFTRSARHTREGGDGCFRIAIVPEPPAFFERPRGGFCGL